MPNRGLWQGKLDMFCGLYCATRIIACYAVAAKADDKTQPAVYEQAAERAFYHLLRSAEELGWLTARKIAAPNVGGYTDLQVERIFNNLPARTRQGLQAIAFRRRAFQNLKNSERRALITDFNACAIIQEDGGRHWITVEGLDRDGDYSCFDPELGDGADTQGRKSKRQRILWDQGVLVGKSKVLARLNAQTH